MSTRHNNIFPLIVVKFYINLLLQTKIDRLQGADIASLEAKIQQHIGGGDGDTGEDFGQGLVTIQFFSYDTRKKKQ